jgi:hypothetical protein
MKKYTVRFLVEAEILDCITAEVNAESEDEILDKLKDGNYKILDSYESDYSSNPESITSFEFLSDIK